MKKFKSLCLVSTLILGTKLSTNFTMPEPIKKIICNLVDGGIHGGGGGTPDNRPNYMKTATLLNSDSFDYVNESSISPSFIKSYKFFSKENEKIVINITPSYDGKVNDIRIYDENTYNIPLAESTSEELNYLFEENKTYYIVFRATPSKYPYRIKLNRRQSAFQRTVTCESNKKCQSYGIIETEGYKFFTRVDIPIFSSNVINYQIIIDFYKSTWEDVKFLEYAMQLGNHESILKLHSDLSSLRMEYDYDYKINNGGPLQTYKKSFYKEFGTDENEDKILELSKEASFGWVRFKEKDISLTPFSHISENRDDFSINVQTIRKCRITLDTTFLVNDNKSVEDIGYFQFTSDFYKVFYTIYSTSFDVSFPFSVGVSFSATDVKNVHIAENHILMVVKGV